MSTPQDSPQQEESFISHLVELRSRLVHAIVAVILVLICLLPWSQDIYTLLATPLMAALPAGGQMIATDVVGAFVVPLKVTLMLAFLIALPYVLWQIWAFVAPGLYAHEKRLAAPILISSVVLFFVGMAFAYFLVFPTVFAFIAKTAPKGVAWMTDIDKYLSFVLTTFLAFGITFEVPVIVVVLVRLGLVQVAKLKEWRPYMVVGAFVVAAIFTPPDIVSQFLLAVPLCLLYELGIFLSRFVMPGDEETPAQTLPVPAEDRADPPASA